MATTPPKQLRRTDRCCPICGTVKLANYFNESPAPYHDKYVPICRNCCNILLKKYIAETKSEAAGLWLLLAQVNIPFINEIYEKAVIRLQDASTKKPSLFVTYLSFMAQWNEPYTGFLQSTNMLTDFLKTVEVEVEKIRTEQKPLKNMKEEIEKWGKFTGVDGKIDRDSYDFLNRTFDEYTADILEMDTNLMNRYRDLCKCELRLRKANESGDGAEISKAQDALNKQLKLLNLDTFDSNKKSEQEKFIDRIAWMIEETEPAEEEDKEKYRDIAGFEHSFKEIMRSMKNLLTGSRDFPDIPSEER
jgi:hypothetical protein